MTAHWRKGVRQQTSKSCAVRLAKLEPRWATGTFLGRTDESDEGHRGNSSRGGVCSLVTRDQWQRDAFTTFIGVPWNPRGLAVEAPMASNRRRYITKFLVQQHQAVQHVWEFHRSARRSVERDSSGWINPSATDVIPAIPRAVEDPSRPAEERQQSSSIRHNPTRRNTFVKLLE